MRWDLMKASQSGSQDNSGYVNGNIMRTDAVHVNDNTLHADAAHAALTHLQILLQSCMS